MCGLLAGSGRLDSKIITALGCLNDKRGSDSAGIAWLEGDKVRLEKIAQAPLVAFPLTLARSIRRAVQEKGPIIGHTRQATHGAVKSENAHPFIDGGIAFAHNGVVTNYKDFGKYEVDSQALIQGILNRDFSKYEGSIALVWIQGGKLHAYRKGNPLFRGVQHGAMYLASERSFLESVGCDKVKELGEARIYKFLGAGVEEARPVPGNQVWAKRWTGSTVIVTGYPDYAAQDWRNPSSGDFPPAGYTEATVIGGKEPEGPPKQESCATPVRVGSLTPPSRREVLKLIPANSRTTGYEDYIESRRLARKNRLDLRYGESTNGEADTLAELDALQEMSEDDLCQNCLQEPHLPCVDYGQACAVEFGLMESKA